MLKRLLHLSVRASNKSLCEKVKMSEGKTLESVVQALEHFAPICAAEKWDNVGLLIEPYKKRAIRKIMLTNDLTERVMQEVLAKNADMIISYHPPIFAPLKRITQSHWKERIVSICLAESIALYSPHTAWDAIPGGVNDWLASALECNNVKPIQPSAALLLLPEGSGAGRLFETKITLAGAIERIQNHIGLDVHVAMGAEHSMDTMLKSVAVCAGAGASLLKGIPADLYLTGEMSHHDVLEAQHQNTSVILCNHSNSERGFLKVFKNQLNDKLGGQCDVLVAEQDEDPLKTYVHQC